ncbi:MAG: arsenic efflux protein [Deltaproteobacteria bacterium]|nr:arsenic efflux protein [Deltaproteobacteria bacterium]
MELVRKVLNETLTIAVFVFVMMVIIDYVNVITRGRVQTLIRGGGFKQYIFSALFGLIPACLGLFLVVGFYVRGLISFGALFAAMIATAGDEELLMFALFPDKTIILLTITFIIAIISGLLIDRIIPILKIRTCEECELSEIHNEDEHFHYFGFRETVEILKNMTLARFLLLLLLAGSVIFFTIHLLTEDEIHSEQVILIIVNLIATFVIITVPEHYLNEHIWNHIAKRHLIKIFVITFSVLFVIELLSEFADLKALVTGHLNLVYMSAILIGLIPQSGPHLIFVMMYAKGIIPFGVLLVNTVVQDGHGLLPLIPHSLRDSLLIKLFKVIISGIILIVLYFTGLM